MSDPARNPDDAVIHQAAARLATHDLHRVAEELLPQVFGAALAIIGCAPDRLEASVVLIARSDPTLVASSTTLEPTDAVVIYRTMLANAEGALDGTSEQVGDQVFMRDTREEGR